MRFPLPNIDALLSAHVRQGVGAALGDVTAAVTFEVQPGAVGRRARRGPRRAPARDDKYAQTVRVDPRTFAGVLEGRLSGMEAFLQGTLTVRGNLALRRDRRCLRRGGPPARVPARTPDHGARRGHVPPRGRPGRRTARGAAVWPRRHERVDAPADPGVGPRPPGAGADTPGFGASAAPRWQYSIGELATWLKEFQQSVGATPAALVGNSLGGRRAIEAGLSNPDSVTRMALLCPSPAFRRLRQLVPAVRLLTPDLSRVPMRFSHAVVTRSVQTMFSKPSRVPHDWYAAAGDEFRRVMKDPAHRRAFFAAARHIYLEEAYGEHGFWDRLPLLATPSLFIWGDADPLVPAAFERHVVAAVPHATSVLLEDCGHVPQFELPDRTNQLVREFLAAE